MFEPFPFRIECKWYKSTYSDCILYNLFLPKIEVVPKSVEYYLVKFAILKACPRYQKCLLGVYKKMILDQINAGDF